MKCLVYPNDNKSLPFFLEHQDWEFSEFLFRSAMIGGVRFGGLVWSFLLMVTVVWWSSFLHRCANLCRVQRLREGLGLPPTGFGQIELRFGKDCGFWAKSGDFRCGLAFGSADLRAL